MSMTTTDPGADKAVQALPELRGDGFWEERMKTIQAECGAPDTPEVWHALWRVRDELERWAISYAREAQRAALTHRQQGVVGQWQPIKTAPADRLVVVGWIDSEDAERPERQDFDYLEDDCWTKWHDYAEHVHMIGGHGVIDAPPYTHWFGLPAIPKASAPALTASPPAQIKHETSEDEVICPNCSHQFRAIPPSVQRLMLDAGFEPPFTAPPAQPQSEPSSDEQCECNASSDQECIFCADRRAWATAPAQPPERAAQQEAQEAVTGRFSSADRLIKSLHAERVYIVPTGEVHEGHETFTRHDSPPPLADFETLYASPPRAVEPMPALTDAEVAAMVDGLIRGVAFNRGVAVEIGIRVIRAYEAARGIKGGE